MVPKYLKWMLLRVRLIIFIAPQIEEKKTIGKRALKILLVCFGVMLLRLGLSSGWRMVSTGTQNFKSDNLVKSLFLRKIKEYESKMMGKGDELVDATPETQRSLEDQLQRLATKYHLESKEIVDELPVKQLETPSVESAVTVMFEGKTIDDLNKELEKEIQQYTEMRRKKQAAEEEARSHLQSIQQLSTEKLRKYGGGAFMLWVTFEFISAVICGFSVPYMHQTHNKSKKFSKKRIPGRKDGKVVKETVESLVARYADFAKLDSRTLTSFIQMPLSEATQWGLKANGFMYPTDIQRESLQYSLTGADVVLECLWRQRWSRTTDGLGALIISPTRELAFQTFQVLNKIGAHHQFSVAVLIGGTDVDFESKRIGSVNIVVCTPGRLLQHMDENSTFSCEQLQILVIDEADRILDLGFSRQMNAILENLPNNRQTLLFSATQTKNVNDLVRLALKDPLYVSAHENAPQATPESLQQSYFVCNDENKINALWSYLRSHRKKKTLIFVSCCKQARFLTEAFCHLRPGFSLMGLWGTMNQMKRLEVFKKFNNKTTGVALIATDVASRGLDFARVDLVLQLDCPVDVDDYIHRLVFSFMEL
uniref:ATP-dependent RNA helicase n=1 Tax=Setaria digitata TaxID=48799 RepID=A0A915PME3_9BILA